VDLRYDNQIIVNPDMERAAKTAPLSQAAARTAAAAGVKPAALITRIGPHDRLVPKPAFELTQKKLDQKAPVAGTRKTVTRPKRKKVSAKAAKPNAGNASPAKPVAVAKKAPASKGQKPSPAVAKTQSSPGPGQ
jgi:hypothetical protein